jgi:hypothetical protein
MQLVIVTLLLRSQHVLAVHGQHQMSTTMLKLLHCTVQVNKFQRIRNNRGRVFCEVRSEAI